MFGSRLRAKHQTLSLILLIFILYAQCFFSGKKVPELNKFRKIMKGSEGTMYQWRVDHNGIFYANIFILYISISINTENTEIKLK